MFTGIIQEVGLLKSRIDNDNRYQLIVGGTHILEGINRGDSIAINGVCLTVIDFTATTFTADIMPETLKASNLSRINIGAGVNLEQAVKLGGFLGGHLLTGHVDGLGIVKKIKTKSNARFVEIEASEKLMGFMVDKGSVALNGISLTIVKVFEKSFTVSLIPETWASTNMNNIKAGAEINIETDLIGKYVYKILSENADIKKKKTNIDKKFLQENGFL